MSEVSPGKISYLKRVLQMNPHSQAEDILSLRARMLGLVDVSRNRKTGQSEDLDQRRTMLRSQIDELRRQFWTLPAQTLRARLESLPVHKFPDLKAAVNRLRLITLYRDQFSSLGSGSGVNINLLNTFKRVIMTPPRESGSLKERYLRQLAHSPAMSEVKKMVKRIKKSYPDLFNIESDWFREIQRVKPRESGGKGGGFEGIGIEIPWWLIGFVVYFIIKLIVIGARFSQ